MVKLQPAPNRSFHPIPPTAVGGWLSFNLHQTDLHFTQYHRRQPVDR
jgi:hypothetical protein